jgi:DNA polymerase-2
LICLKWAIPLPFNREPDQPVVRKRPYVFYLRAGRPPRQQVPAGALALDTFNAMMFHDYGLDGILESARVTGMPVQLAGRLSPGSGISAMQVVTALRSQVLVPWHKQQVEEPKSALEMIRADQGGLVYQPRVGLHQDVAEIDFISMYPGIMVRFNISPRLGQIPLRRCGAALDGIDQSTTGLVPATGAVVEKRIALEKQPGGPPRWDLVAVPISAPLINGCW